MLGAPSDLCTLLEGGGEVVEEPAREQLEVEANATGTMATATGTYTEVIDAAGRVVMPAFVDCHTHACFVGDRNDEFEARLAGASYLEILAAGGGNRKGFVCLDQITQTRA